MMMGIALLASFAARLAGVPHVTMTSTALSLREPIHEVEVLLLYVAKLA